MLIALRTVLSGLSSGPCPPDTDLDGATLEVELCNCDLANDGLGSGSLGVDGDGGIFDGTGRPFLGCCVGSGGKAPDGGGLVGCCKARDEADTEVILIC